MKQVSYDMNNPNERAKYQRTHKKFMAEFKKEAHVLIDQMEGPFTVFGMGEKNPNGSMPLLQLIAFAGGLEDITALVLACEQIKRDMIKHAVNMLPEEEAITYLQALKAYKDDPKKMKKAFIEVEK